jgi:hypothetical protein
MAARSFSRLILLGLILGSSRPAIAQRAATSQEFSPTSLRRTVETIAHDSMLGRATPSSQLELAARYVAEQFRASGLQPFDSSYLAPFPVLETVLDEDSTRIEIDSFATWRFGQDFWYAAGAGGDPSGSLRGQVVVVTGSVPAETVKRLGVTGKVVIYLSPVNERGRPNDFRSVFTLIGASPLAIIVPGARPDSLWQRLRQDSEELKPSTEAAWPVWTAPPADGREGMVQFIPVLEVWGGRFDRMLARMGLDSTSLYAAGGTAKATPANLEATLRFVRKVERKAWPPNVVAVLPGSDPVLRNEYVVLTAHLDGLGSARHGPPGPASVFNGADDNASGVAAILEVARVLGPRGPRPKRSVIFAAVSGEENGLWGSDYLVSHPPLQLDRVVANVNLDMVGRARGDSVFLLSSDQLGPLVSRTLRQTGTHGLNLLDEAELDRRYPGENLEERSDHANFVRRGVPAVVLFTGLHQDYHTTTDDPDKLNYEALSRIARLAHDLVKALADQSD